MHIYNKHLKAIHIIIVNSLLSVKQNYLLDACLANSSFFAFSSICFSSSVFLMISEIFNYIFSSSFFYFHIYGKLIKKQFNTSKQVRSIFLCFFLLNTEHFPSLALLFFLCFFKHIISPIYHIL